MEPIEICEDTLTLDREQVRAFDKWAIEDLGIPGMVLMENAGLGCVELVESFIEDTPDAKVCIICGTGNNGGDGFVIARHLFNAGVQVQVVIAGDVMRIKGDARQNLTVLQCLQVAIETFASDDPVLIDYLRAVAGESDVVVDALFGTGLSGPLRKGYDEVVTAINQLKRPVLAVDIPSGLDCNTGEVLGRAIEATWTVTFVAVKTGFIKKQARDVTGLIYVASIGIEPASWPALTDL